MNIYIFKKKTQAKMAKQEKCMNSKSVKVQDFAQVADSHFEVLFF